MIQSRQLSGATLQVDSLDGLRGFAVLCVFLGHTSLFNIFLFPAVNFAGVGKSGVYLFFILSSFLLSSAFVRNGPAAYRKEFLMNYALRRFCRVYPLYFLYLLLGLVTTYLFLNAEAKRYIAGIPFALSPSQFFQHLLLTQSFGITWSISVEFRYYFLLPLVALIPSILRKNRIMVSIVFTVLMIAGSQWLWPEGLIKTNDNRLGPYLPLFFMGSLLAVLVEEWRHSSLHANRRAAAAFELLGFAAALVLIGMIPSIFSLIMGRPVEHDNFHHKIILYGLLWSAVLFACIAGAGWLRRIFEMPFLRYLGFISFSMYLWHIVALNEAVMHFRQVFSLVGGNVHLMGWLILGTSIAISHVTWALVEKPSAKIRIRFAAPRQQHVPA